MQASRSYTQDGASGPFLQSAHLLALLPDRILIDQKIA